MGRVTQERVASRWSRVGTLVRSEFFVSKPRSRNLGASEGQGGDDDRDGPLSRGVFSDLLPHLWRFRTQFREGRDAEKVLRSALRLGLDFFGAHEGCVATVQPGGEEARILLPVPSDCWWDRLMLAGFLRGDKVRVPPELMLARIRRHGRMWGALAVRGPSAGYHWDARQAFSSIGELANELIDQIDQERVREVRARVDRKVLEQSLPKHLFYEVLHGIRSLTAYDHSAVLLTYDDEVDALEVVAEQIAWQKAKGQNVGRKLPISTSLREGLCRSLVCGFDRNGREWKEWTGTDATELVELLDFDGQAGPGGLTPREGAILCAPLVTRVGLLGVLKVAAIAPRSFRQYEVELVSQFLPQAAVALQNARRAESLQQRVLIAERKHAMADLARGVSHDVNNALGAVLPLIQQLREEIKEGTLDPAVAARDLAPIERSIQVCRRIFGGMLKLARGTALNLSEVSLCQAAENALAILREGLERRGVRLKVEIPSDLPPLYGVQADIEQLLLNLVSNARDSTKVGDQLAIRATCDGASIELVVEDTGCGIPKEHLAKIQEPFFTTKADGHGLGLAICRSIVAEMRGQLWIESAAGAGTRVRALFPLQGEGAA
jgi:two-component system, NtrC family, sensor kinase